MKRIISIAILATIILHDVAVASTSGKSGKSGGTTPHYLFSDCNTIKRTYKVDARGYAIYPGSRKRELVKGSINNRHRRRILQDAKKEKAATTKDKEKSKSKAEKAVVIEETKYGKSCKSKKAKSAKAKSAKKGGSAKVSILLCLLFMFGDFHVEGEIVLTLYSLHFKIPLVKPIYNTRLTKIKLLVG